MMATRQAGWMLGFYSGLRLSSPASGGKGFFCAKFGIRRTPSGINAGFVAVIKREFYYFPILMDYFC